MISIICVYNNKEILDNYLLRGLKKQTAEFELIALDNTQGKFKSATEALNYGGRKSKGKYIMFVHQDVELGSNLWLKEVEELLDNMSNLGIAGVAGRSKNKRGTITNIKHGNPPRLAGKIQINNPINAQTVDECLTIVPKSVFNLLQFDEQVCDDWHLYAVDYCLSIKKFGYNVYIIPMFVYHRSPGYSMSGGYYSTLGKLLKKHKWNYKWIYTTMGNWSTFYPLIIQRAKLKMIHLAVIVLEKLGIKTQVRTLLKNLKVLKK